MAYRSQAPRSIDRAFTILVELQNMCRGARLSELARRTGLAKSTTHRMLGALVNVGLASRTGKLYQAVGTCRGGCNGIDSDRRALLNGLAPFLGDLTMRTGLTASLAVLQGTDVVFTHRVYGHQGVWTSSDDTGREPAHRTAAGRLLLAYDSRMARDLTDTWGAETDQESGLTRDLLTIRRQHFAANTNDNGVLCVAMPLHRRPDMPNVAFTVKGRADTAEPEILLRHLRHVVWAAANKTMHPNSANPVRQSGKAASSPMARTRAAS